MHHLVSFKLLSIVQPQEGGREGGSEGEERESEEWGYPDKVLETI